MNSIVERLREYQESWADSIKRMDCGEFGDNGIMTQIRAEQHATWKEAADLIEQQAERIKELEAERDGWREDANISRNSIVMLKDRCNHLEDTLTALRQRIADAPVVCIAHTRPLQGNESRPTVHAEWKFPAKGALISKEDLL